MSDESVTHGGGESYSGILPAKQPNNGGSPPPEDVEGRPLIKDIPGNWARMKAFGNGVLRMWFQSLRRRSQRSRLPWDGFLERLGNLLPPVQILQPYPDVRFDAKHLQIRDRNRVR